MTFMKRVGWCALVLLAASLMWTTGCGGSDGDDDGTTTSTVVGTNSTGETFTTSTVVVTNSTGGTTTVVVTNTLTPSGPLVLVLLAPQQVLPYEGQKFGTSISLWTMDVQFQWTSVPLASYYVLEVGGQTYPVNGTTKTLSLTVNDYKWRVNAVNASGANGLVSGWVNFKVQHGPIVVEEL